MLSIQITPLLLLGVVAAVVADVKCPAPEFLKPLQCECTKSISVRCRNINSDKQLRLIMTACEGHRLEEFVLIKASLNWLPDDLFNFINTRQFVVSRSAFQSLAKPDESGAELFCDSGIETFVLDNTTLEDEDLSQLGGLSELKNFGIRNYNHLLPVTQLQRLLDVSNLQSLFLENMPDFRWSPGALKPFSQLIMLTLSGVKLQQISRADLPDYVDSLATLSLRNNSLTDIPSDLLSEMEQLISLDLSHNKITTLAEETLQKFNGRIGLNGNPWKCDGNLDWLKKRLREGSLKSLYGQKIYCGDGTPLFEG